MRNIALLLLLLVLLMLPSVHATIDLLTPEDGSSLNNGTIIFEYYVSIPALQSCQVHVNGQAFPDPGAQSNAMNSVQVQNIIAGQYAWNVTCTGNETERSPTRTFEIDSKAPTLVMVQPENESIVSELHIDIIPNDDMDERLSCEIFWKGQRIDAANVTRNTHYAQSYHVDPGTSILSVMCRDDAGNTIRKERVVTIEPEPFVTLSTDKPSYDIDEQVHLTIDAIPGSDITVDICPNQQGFVQCTSALLSNDIFPQTVTLPYMNKTGEYLVDAFVGLGQQTASSQVMYEIVNSMRVGISAKTQPDLNETLAVEAGVTGGAPPYNLIWNLPNGTQRSGVSSIDVLFNDEGSHNITVTAMDSAGNTRSATKEFFVLPMHDVAVTVKDNKTGLPIRGASVEFAEEEHKALPDGTAIFSVKEGTHTLFISAQGYQYLVEDHRINTSRAITALLEPSNDVPLVQIKSPVEGDAVGLPATIRFIAKHPASLTCTLLLATDENWFLDNGTMEVEDDSTREFKRNYPVGQHTVQVECKDGSGVRGVSEKVSFEVLEKEEPLPAQTLENDIFLQESIKLVDEAIGNLEQHGQKEQRASLLLSFENDLRDMKRSIQQAIRDIDSLQFRDDVQDKESERQRIVDNVRKIVEDTPRTLSVEGSETFVRYVGEEEMPDISEMLAGLDGMPDDPARLNDLLIKDQQKFTLKTTVMHVSLGYGVDRTETVTLVHREFTYADDIHDGYFLIEIIPKHVQRSASTMHLVTDAEVLEDDPILRFPSDLEMTYVLPGKKSFTQMQEVKTVLAQDYQRLQKNSITGMAFFSSGVLNSFAWPMIALVILIVAGYLSYYLDLFTKFKYVFYRMGKHEKIHYLRVLINEVDDYLSTDSYGKAELLYKEIRMTYDNLSDMEKNDLYEDVMEIVHKMDVFYFNMITIEMDGHIKEGDIEAAISSYEKLLGTYDRLDPARQKELVERVTALGNRLGMGVGA